MRDTRLCGPGSSPVRAHQSAHRYVVSDREGSGTGNVRAEGSMPISFRTDMWSVAGYGERDGEGWGMAGPSVYEPNVVSRGGVVTSE